jgi:hypothetical protein
MADQMTLEKAIEWTDRAVTLGYYSASVARLLRSATEALSRILAEDERTTEYVREHEEAVLSRLINGSEKLSHTSARTYMTRAMRLVRDFEAWSANPAAFVPKPTRNGDDDEKPKRKSSKTPAKESGEEEIPPTHREHVLSLSGGKATLRLPVQISLYDVQLLTLVIGSHCPEARVAQFDFLKRKPDPPSDEQIVARSS